MGFFDKKTEDQQNEEPKRSGGSDMDLVTRPRRDCECYIAHGTTVEGKITGGASVGIDGLVKGEMNISSKVIIGETGEIKGNIKADDIIVAGKINGNIEARNILEAQPTGQIFGDINANRLMIADGVLFEGNITMKKEKHTKREKVEEPVITEPEPVTE
ncbi:MAG: polymer-forming cytoskeletal protein [Deltaproteobacteria bacterium]|nr:polymer-forming cytoskeletal protein [Candidatus Zymogenaceae bacterium]